MSLWLYINISDLLLRKKMETRLEEFERSCKLIFDVPQSPLGPNSELLMEECGREKSNLAFVESDKFNLHVQSNIVSDSDPVEDSFVLGILDKLSIVLNSCVPFDSTHYSPDNSSSYDEKNKEIVRPPARHSHRTMYLMMLRSIQQQIRNTYLTLVLLMTNSTKKMMK